MIIQTCKDKAQSAKIFEYFISDDYENGKYSSALSNAWHNIIWSYAHFLYAYQSG